MANVQIAPQFARQILAYLATRPIKEAYNLFTGLSGALAQAEGVDLPSADEFASEGPGDDEDPA